VGATGGGSGIVNGVPLCGQHSRLGALWVTLKFVFLYIDVWTHAKHEVSIFLQGNAIAKSQDK